MQRMCGRLPSTPLRSVKPSRPLRPIGEDSSSYGSADWGGTPTCPKVAVADGRLWVNRRRVRSARAGGSVAVQSRRWTASSRNTQPARGKSEWPSAAHKGRPGFRSEGRRATLTDVRDDAAQAALEIPCTRTS
jgi:hypothetical protein